MNILKISRIIGVSDLTFNIKTIIEDIYLRIFISDSPPIVVTFTGGMGAQIISAAIYFYLINLGFEVYADLSYFNKMPYKAEEKQKGDISQWGWQLDCFGLLPDSFHTLINTDRKKQKIIPDGIEKVILGMNALKMDSIKKIFIESNLLDEILPIKYRKNYLCIHIRRGDYLSLARYIVDDKLFIDIAKKTVGLVSGVVVLSDSVIDNSFRCEMSRLYKNSLFLDEIDAIDAHRIMRNANFLICSNSQFSLTAGLLNNNGLIFLPKKWFDVNLHPKLEAIINQMSEFNVLK